MKVSCSCVHVKPTLSDRTTSSYKRTFSLGLKGEPHKNSCLVCFFLSLASLVMIFCYPADSKEAEHRRGGRVKLLLLNPFGKQRPQISRCEGGGGCFVVVLCFVFFGQWGKECALTSLVLKMITRYCF